MEKGTSEKKLALRKPIKIIMVFIIVLFAALSYYNFYCYYHPVKIVKEKYNYKINEKIDYKVYLKENNFYEEEYLPSGKQYTADLIDHIDIDMTYLLTGSKIIDLDYSYTTDATIIGEYENSESESPELWKKHIY